MSEPEIISFTARVIAGVKDDMNFEEMTDEQLRSTLEEAMRTNRTLTLENEVFERYLQRKDPDCLRKLTSLIESTRQMQKLHRLRVLRQQQREQQQDGSRIGSIVSLPGSGSGGHQLSSSTSLHSAQLARTTSGSQQFSAGGGGGGGAKRVARGLKITVAHRIELTNKELEDIKKNFKEFERGILKEKKILEAQLKEMRCRIKETEEAEKTFDKDVVNGADPVTNKIPMEKFVRFIDEQTKLASITTDKLNLQMITAKRLISETKKQIKARQDLGKDLRPIDFEKLRIENQYLIEENEQNHRALKLLKLISGHYNLMMKHRKDKLIERKAQLQLVEKALSSRRRQHIELRRSQVRTKHDVRQVQGQLTSIKELKDEYEIPEIEEFLFVVKQLTDAKKDFKNLTRKRKIQLFTIKLSQQHRH